MIIDCHLHLPAIGIVKNYKEAKIKLLHDLKQNNIKYAILIPDNVKNSSIGDMDDCLDLFKKEKKIFLMGTINIFRDPFSHLKKLDQLLKNRKIVAIKIFPGHDKHFPTDKRLIPIYKLCLKHDAPIVIHTGWNTGHPEVAKYNDPKYIVKIAKKFPKLKIVIAHYFWPKIEYCYKITRPYKNICFDASGLADKEVVDATGRKKIKQILEKTINDSQESVLFGTDYNMCITKNHIDLIKSLEMNNEIKRKIFSQNAIKLFKLKLK
ncbi:MAG: amidohydrolase family protein [Patescibacteria group bacterium]|mgnify:CR=1 FL=1